MRILKYISLPSKESEHEPRITSVNEAGELADPQWNSSADSPDSDNVRYDNTEEERETMLNKERGEEDTMVDIDESMDAIDYGKEKSDRSILPCLCIAGVFVVAWLVSAIIYAFYKTGSSSIENIANRIQFDDLYNSSFSPEYKDLIWNEADGEDGTFVYRDYNDDIILERISDRKKQTLVKGSDLIDVSALAQIHLAYFDFSISPDSNYVLLSTNRTKQWRYSHFSNYLIFNITSKSLFPLTKPIDDDHQAVISYARWSPVGHTVAFIKDNDVYISVDLVDVRRITFDGSAVVFNGMPDWIYEEEVLRADNAIWWSDDGKRLAYLRLNESEVPEYRFPMYMNGFNVDPYPKEVVIRYPEPGYPNPIVTFHIYDLETPLRSQSAAILFEDDFPDDDKLITEVLWAGNEKILVRVMNRIQDLARVVLVDSNLRTGVTIREENANKMDGGWYEINKSWVYKKKSGSLEQDGYIDVVVNQGYDHLALFSPIDSSTPKFLTSGKWEVDGSVLAVDYKQELIYFISTEKSSTERHIYSVTWDGKNRTALTDISNEGYYSASFSPGAQYYNLRYEGPGIPWQKVLKVGDKSFGMVLTENNGLKELMNSLELPTKKHLTININGNTFNAIEIRPPGMDDSGKEKYPVLFNIYGGPASQIVNTKFTVDWHMFLASSDRLKYITVLVDTRGTGFQGRSFRCVVRGRLGEIESEDIINAGRHWAGLPYVDSNRMAIWGWSFGGFLTTKIIESDSGVFQVGMAVAPVTDWRQVVIFYDSIYTERYMKTPAQNQKGYEYSAITNMTGFEHAKFLVVHGTGDDNVHFQNTANLIDRLTLASVHNYRVQFYTDSNHNIFNHNANRELYYLLTEYLWQSFGTGGIN
ncbi:5806_t:CDS:10 [Funneliformis geosporum]|uniref:11703_t:CDS:1 n=1 Tax=Funneliformis geosporum TaxID=1117311 RepID=A0A9W4WQK7_9GLOM|nr:5806_t:CDS:10 [Funneliformis geosporum]CAI2164644.1 11703_t:CDS:10 [Funneliformis geosporum]